MRMQHVGRTQTAQSAYPLRLALSCVRRRSYARQGTDKMSCGNTAATPVSVPSSVKAAVAALEAAAAAGAEPDDDDDGYDFQHFLQVLGLGNATALGWRVRVTGSMCRARACWGHRCATCGDVCVTDITICYWAMWGGPPPLDST